jgi:hypothetical protein
LARGRQGLSSRNYPNTVTWMSGVWPSQSRHMKLRSGCFDEITFTALTCSPVAVQFEIDDAAAFACIFTLRSDP